MCQGSSRKWRIRKVKGIEGLNYEVIDENSALPFDDHQNDEDNSQDHKKMKLFKMLWPMVFQIVILIMYLMIFYALYQNFRENDASSICRMYLPVNSCIYNTTNIKLSIDNWYLLVLTDIPLMWLQNILQLCACIGYIYNWFYYVRV